MPNDIQGGVKDLSGAVAKSTAQTPHQSFMTVAGQAIGVVLLAEVAGSGPTAARIVSVIIFGLWLAFLVNNADTLFGVLTVRRQ